MIFVHHFDTIPHVSPSLIVCNIMSRKINEGIYIYIYIYIYMRERERERKRKRKREKEREKLNKLVGKVNKQVIGISFFKARKKKPSSGKEENERQAINV